MTSSGVGADGSHLLGRVPSRQRFTDSPRTHQPLAMHPREGATGHLSSLGF